MAEIKVEVEVWCECGEGLCGQSSTHPRGRGIIVAPCEKCLETANEEGDDEGYNRGAEECS